MEEFKIHVTEVLTRHASAILLDPEWGIPASKRRSKDAGLLLAYEKTGYDANTPGRLPDLLDVWSVRRLKEAGADCIKILLYYTPFDSDTRSTTTSTPGSSGSATSAAPTTSRSFSSSSATKKARTRKGLEFAKRSRRSSPATHAGVHEGSLRRGRDEGRSADQHEVRRRARGFGGQKAYTKQEAMDHFRRSADVATKPFIYLSAGVSNAEFTESLELAAEAGTRFSGVLCGRATWKEGIPVFGKQGGQAFRTWLEDEGVRNIKNVNDRLKAARPWFEFYGAATADALR